MRTFHLDNKKKLIFLVTAFVSLTGRAGRADSPSEKQLITEIVRRYDANPEYHYFKGLKR